MREQALRGPVRVLAAAGREWWSDRAGACRVVYCVRLAAAAAVHAGRGSRQTGPGACVCPARRAPELPRRAREGVELLKPVLVELKVLGDGAARYLHGLATPGMRICPHAAAAAAAAAAAGRCSPPCPRASSTHVPQNAVVQDLGGTFQKKSKPGGACARLKGALAGHWTCQQTNAACRSVDSKSSAATCSGLSMHAAGKQALRSPGGQAAAKRALLLASVLCTLPHTAVASGTHSARARARPHSLGRAERCGQQCARHLSLLLQSCTHTCPGWVTGEETGSAGVGVGWGADKTPAEQALPAVRHGHALPASSRCRTPEPRPHISAIQGGSPCSALRCLNLRYTRVWYV